MKRKKSFTKKKEKVFYHTSRFDGPLPILHIPTLQDLHKAIQIKISNHSL